MNIAVLISNAGTGTNLQAIIDAVQNKTIAAKIAIVVSDTADAYGLVRAQKHHVKTHILQKKENLALLLKDYKVDWVALAGWKKIISDEMIQTFHNQILNLHPGLIPDTFDGTVTNPDGTMCLWNRGKFTDAAIQNFLQTKATYAGSTIHFLSHQFDFGPVLGRCFEKIRTNDTVETLYRRLKLKENALYVAVLKKVCNKNVKKKILIIGSGGREHAIGWKLAQSPQVEKLYFAPGNGGTAQLGENIPIKAEDIPGLLGWAKENTPDLVVVGPEIPLALGIVDELAKLKIPAFGPTTKAAQIETSKVFAKNFMQKYGIPTARFATFADFKKANQYLETIDYQVVIKASGLAAGKGVIVPQSASESREALVRIMQLKEFGEAGNEVIIEERLSGEEVSLLAFTDGKTIVPMPPAQDHKRLLDGDRGPNTGGMGAYARAPICPPGMVGQIVRDIIRPAIYGLAKEGIRYQGVLYAGLMLTDKGPKVLEFNCRFGDPETQAILPLLKTDLVSIFESCIAGNLDTTAVQWKKEAALCVVLTASGYPHAYAKGMEIKGIDRAASFSDIIVFHAGTSGGNGHLHTTGGRVLAVTGLGENLSVSQNKTYSALKRISFDGVYFRTDIGNRAIK